MNRVYESKIQTGPLSESSIFEHDLPGRQESLSEVVGMLSQKAPLLVGCGLYEPHAGDFEYCLIGMVLWSQSIFLEWLLSAYGE